MILIVDKIPDSWRDKTRATKRHKTRKTKQTGLQPGQDDSIDISGRAGGEAIPLSLPFPTNDTIISLHPRFDRATARCCGLNDAYLAAPAAQRLNVTRAVANANDQVAPIRPPPAGG